MFNTAIVRSEQVDLAKALKNPGETVVRNASDISLLEDQASYAFADCRKIKGASGIALYAHPWFLLQEQHSLCCRNSKSILVQRIGTLTLCDYVCRDQSKTVVGNCFRSTDEEGKLSKAILLRAKQLVVWQPQRLCTDAMSLGHNKSGHSKVG